MPNMAYMSQLQLRFFPYCHSADAGKGNCVTFPMTYGRSNYIYDVIRFSASCIMTVMIDLLMNSLIQSRGQKFKYDFLRFSHIVLTG